MDLEDYKLFLSRHEKDLYTFCRHLAISHDLADDLYQETALKSLEVMHKINVDNNPKAYMFAIALGIWKNMRRKIKRREVIAPTISLENAAAELPGSESVEMQAEQEIRDKIVREAVSKLDDKYRIPMLLMYFGSYNIAEIAQICKIPNGTVKHRLYKGRGLIRTALEKEGVTVE